MSEMTKDEHGLRVQLAAALQERDEARHGLDEWCKAAMHERARATAVESERDALRAAEADALERAAQAIEGIEGGGSLYRNGLHAAAACVRALVSPESPPGISEAQYEEAAEARNEPAAAPAACTCRYLSGTRFENPGNCPVHPDVAAAPAAEPEIRRTVHGEEDYVPGEPSEPVAPVPCTCHYEAAEFCRYHGPLLKAERAHGVAPAHPQSTEIACEPAPDLRALVVEALDIQDDCDHPPGCECAWCSWAWKAAKAIASKRGVAPSAAETRIAELERVIELSYPFVAEGDENTTVDGLTQEQIVRHINKVMRAVPQKGEGT